MFFNALSLIFFRKITRYTLRLQFPYLYFLIVSSILYVAVTVFVKEDVRFF